MKADNDYANFSEDERFAGAFANAIDYIRFAGLEGWHSTHSLVLREWYVPGTFEMVRVLLRHPIYRRHPLNRGN